MPPIPLVLLVLEDPAFRGPLMLALRDRGLRVQLTPDPLDAAAFLASNDVAVVMLEGRGIEWIRARRAEGSAAQMVLCAATKEEQQRLVSVVGGLDVSSIVPKALAPEVVAAHVDELVTAPAPEPAQNPHEAQLAAGIESLRVSIVNLQKNAESRDRILSSLAEARRLRETASSVSAAGVGAAAKQIEDILAEARDGRRRLDNASFTPIDRALARARVSISAPAPAAVTPRRVSAAAHTPAEGPAARVAPEPAYATDPVTGLPARDEFLRLVQERADGAEIDGRPLSLCVLGIEGAPVLLGAGLLDGVMQETARFLLGRFRTEDLRGRFAPDAFGLAFSGTPAPAALGNMQRTLEAFASLRLVGPQGPVTIGIGVATFPKEAKEARLALAIANRRMEAARVTGTVRGP